MKLVPTSSIVIREGQKKEVPTGEILPGDLISLKSGDKIPADIRIIYINGEFKVDNSSLTGEAEAQDRSLESGNTEPMRAQNLAFNGTLVSTGEAMGIVIKTGDDTALGKLAQLTTSEKNKESQLQIEIDTFVKNLATLAIIVGVSMFSLGMGLGYQLNQTFSFFVGIFLSFVPQGLPTKITVLLTIGASRMAEKNVLVKDLNAIETLGCITFLASDKTGTLTLNKMTVVGGWVDEKKFEIRQKPIENNILRDIKITDIVSPSPTSKKKLMENLHKMLEISSLCSK